MTPVQRFFSAPDEGKIPAAIMTPEGLKVVVFKPTSDASLLMLRGNERTRGAFAVSAVMEGRKALVKQLIARQLAS